MLLLSFRPAAATTRGVIAGKIVRYETRLREYLGHLMNSSDVKTCIFFRQDEVSDGAAVSHVYACVDIKRVDHELW